MDNFTLAVIISDILMTLAFVALIVLDKPRQPGPAEPVKVTGKRPA
jgi:hypothetical protein